MDTTRAVIGFFAVLAVSLSVVLIAGGEAVATSVERMIMPGEVIGVHAKYENECGRCHKPFSKVTQSRLCLDCHDKVDKDMTGKAGYHGISPEAISTECSHCHTEHKGRGFDAVRLDKETFDHTQTDYALKGKHASVVCAGCHEQKKKFRDAPSKCLDCHKRDDVHKGKLGEKCAGCHDEKSWRKASFDHSKTKFQLAGKHAGAPCSSCHPNERHKDTPSDCASCHKLEDTHAGSYGKKCNDCHNARQWKKASFDHDKTKFPLKETHIKVRCFDCHGQQFYGKKVPTDCAGCHKNDDEHKGRFGEKCKDCHTPGRWKKSSFDHSKTKFALRETHEKAACNSCHRAVVGGGKLDSACYGCHKGMDAHKGQQGKSCEKCHNVKGWATRVSFDHDITKFPLIGLHAVAPCEQCHTSAAYKDTKKGCVDCHKKDDDHKMRLGERCDSCHNPNGWRLWRFDHAKQSAFVIDGAHRSLDCLACHKEPVKEISLSGCYSCHRAEDEHDGRFGKSCERCHLTSSFKKLKDGVLH